MKLNGFKKPGQLWNWWGVNKGTFYDWRNRKSIPFDQLILLAQNKNLSLHWLFWDEGSPFRSNISEDNLLLGDQIKELIACLDDKGPLIESLLLLLKERVLPSKENLVKTGGNETPR